MNLRKRGLALLMCICMVFTLLPFSVFAENDTGADTGSAAQVPDGKAKIGDTVYDTLEAAVNAAPSDATATTTIYLGAGNYTLYNKGATTSNKNLTFVGQGANETTYHIGAEDTTHPDGPCDYSLDGRGTDMKETVTFKDMTIDAGKYPAMQTNNAYLHGLAGIDNIVLENCTFNGIASYWGYSTTTFNNVTFNAPGTEESGISGVDYSLWTWTGTEYNFNNCTFNASGKIINVYRGGSNTADNPYVLNFMNCTVNSSESNKSVLNIKDNTHYYNINISGTNVITGLNPNSNTCSKLFQVEGVGDNYNLSGGEGNGKNCRATVKIDGETVWENGKMVSHEYTDGYKDNAFETKIEKLPDRTVTTRTCKYCGWTEESTIYNWNIPLSKTATEFDKDYKTDVTLSVPGVQQSLDSDVVFVLDKSTSAELENQAIELLTQLKNQVQDTGAKVKVGVVIFNKEANVTKLTDITSEGGLDKITGAIQAKLKDGTNTHAGLLAGKALLDNDTSVSPERKYLIFVSDGITYMYNKNPTAIAWGFTADTPQHFAGPDNYNSKYGNNNPPADWTVWLNNAKTQIDQLAPKYEYEYGKEPTDITDVSDYATTANSIDKALYLTNEVYQEAKAEGYNCYALAAESNVGAAYAWGPSFMNMLAGGKTVSFDSIKNDILYAVGTDSYVVDKIGDDFTLVQDSLKVGICTIKEDGTKDVTYLNSFKTDPDPNGNWTQYFGDSDAATVLMVNYRFMVAYDAASKTLTWTFNENVSNFAPVQLTYTLKLTTPATNPGTYGQLDRNGDGKIDGTGEAVDSSKALYTNEFAKLTPVDSFEHEGLPVEFPKPSLAYTVEKPYIPPVDPGIRDKITVEITGNSDSVVYDGTEHSVKDYTVKISDSRYTEKDFTFSGKALASGINAGTYEMGLKADQFKNINARFRNVEFVIKADGVLTITQRPLTITAGSAEGIAPVTCDEYTVEGLATGDKVDSVKITGIQSEPGESPNVASDAVIKNAKGEDVTANYKITYVDGVLKAIEVLNKEIHFNYVIGYTDGTIRPNNDISRAEVATIFFRLLTDEARTQYDKTTSSFSDIKDGAWCCRAVSTLTNMGIIKGYTDGTFQPNKSITRAELATIIARFAKLDVNTKTFSDITGHWAQKSIELAAGNGWINGYEDGTFRPNNNITRAETFAMINRVLDRQTESVSDLLPTSEMNMWSDNLNENAWYYKDVQEATNYHKCDRVGDSVYEKWTEKVPDIDWASYQI